MGLLLHLTDLHLGPRGGDIATADRKVKVIPERDLQTRVADAKAVLRRVGERMNGRRFSAVVISGDITVGNSQQGFDALRPFLDTMSNMFPTDPRAIIVVPGNHDVDWSEQAGSPAKYANFTRAIRGNLKATTPFLEGTDDLKSAAWSSGKGAHYWVEPTEGWAIVPLNSSNYCGSNAALEGLSDIDVKNFAAAVESVPNSKEILAALDSLRRFDIARVSPDQFEAFRGLVDAARTDLTSDVRPSPDRPPLLVGVTHHHLLPVGDDEEIKPFEGFTNLGKLRDELRANGIDVLLHGHKHKLAAYWDRQDRSDQPRHDLLVLSGTTIGGEGGDRENPCRIVEIQPVAGGHSVTAMSAQQFIADTGAETVRALRLFGGWEARAEDSETVTIHAANFDEAYARVQSLPVFKADTTSRALHNVVVRVVDGQTVGERAPAGYPDDVVDTPTKLDEWFANIAGWWQRELSELPSDMYFTHGMRIRKYDGVLDQLVHAKEVLTDRDPANGRAVVMLIDPEFDFRKEGRKKLAGWFPAFSMAQVYYSRQGQKDYLNIVGFFRKQELKYWWAINVKELRLILQELISRGVKGEIGSITTVATIAVVDKGRPRVAVPALDRWYDVDKSRIADLISSVVGAGVESRSSKAFDQTAGRDLWREALVDLVPAAVPPDRHLENVPLTTKGLELASVLLDAFAKQDASASLLALRDHLRTVHKHHQKLRDIVLRPTEDGRKAFDLVRASLETETAEIRKLIETMLG